MSINIFNLLIYANWYCLCDEIKWAGKCIITQVENNGPQSQAKLEKFKRLAT